MTLNYRLIQFSDDPVRGEYRNIGVAVDDGSIVIVKTIDELWGYQGIQNGVQGLLQHVPEAAGALVMEWIWRLKALGDQHRGDVRSFHAELDLIAGSDGNVVSFDRGVMDNARVGNIETAAQWMMRRMLGGASEFDALVGDLVRDSEVIWLSGFTWNPVLTCHQDSEELKEVAFRFGVRTKNYWKLAKSVPLRNASKEEVLDRVAAVSINFDITIRENWARQRELVIVSDKKSSELGREVRGLSDRYTWIDVNDAKSPRQLGSLWND